MLRALTLALALAATAPAHALDAFPGAMGFGKGAAGGRGGAIVYVTTTADSGPGSLRACLDMTGPRVCVFRKGGVFRFTSTRPIINDPYLSILGQTAPGGGVGITHAGGATGYSPITVKNTHDVVIRNVSVMLDQQAGININFNDAFTVEDSSKVILDHVTGVWATDEGFGPYADATDITIQNSIAARGLSQHSKCALLGTDAASPVRVTMARNLCAENKDRNPDANNISGSCFEVVNNLFYGAQSEFTEFDNAQGGFGAIVQSNHYRKAPFTSSQAPALGYHEEVVGGPKPRVYWKSHVYDPTTIPQYGPGASALVVTSKPSQCSTAGTPLINATSVFDSVLDGAGAWPRNSVVQGVIADVRDRVGGIPSVAGSIPVIATGTPYADVDLDGMPDAYEPELGAVVGVHDPWADGDGDGWPNLDDAMDRLSRDRIAGRYPS